jgi:hypothetical protein
MTDSRQRAIVFDELSVGIMTETKGSPLSRSDWFTVTISLHHGLLGNQNETKRKCFHCIMAQDSMVNDNKHSVSYLSTFESVKHYILKILCGLIPRMIKGPFRSTFGKIMPSLIVG